MIRYLVFRIIALSVLILSIPLLVKTASAGDIPIFDATDYPIDAFQIDVVPDGHAVSIAGQDNPHRAPNHFVIRTADGYMTVDNFRDGRQASGYIKASAHSPAAYLFGDLGATFPYVMNALQTDYPRVKILVIKDVLGGFEMGPILDGMQMIYDAGMATVLEHDSMVSSAGTYVFMAGKYRHVMDGAKIGVHDFGTKDSQRADDDMPLVKAIGDFIKKTDVGDGIYDFIRSHPHDTMYWMTAHDIKKYNINNATLAHIEKITGANASKN